MDSTYNLRIPLTVAESAQLNLIRQMSLFFKWIPQTVLDSANTVADSAKLPVFGAILSGTVF